MEAEQLRSEWGTAELAHLWERVREVLESAEQPATFRLELPDQPTRDAVGALYGRPMWGLGTRISVSKLDERVRELSGRGLGEVLEVLHGRPLGEAGAADRSSSGAPGGPDSADPVLAALAEHDLADRPWARSWVSWFHQFGRVSAADLPVVAPRSAAVLAELALEQAPAAYCSRAELAARHGDAHQLDNGTTLVRVVLRAAALAHDVEPPSGERDRRALWERCGVTLEAVSATALCWALPLNGGDLAPLLRQRTALGLPVHLSHLDLQLLPEQLVEPGTVVAVCENARVLEEAARQGAQHPLVCVDGYPSTVAASLLQRLADSGAVLRFHADLDWTGVRIAGSLAAHGGRPWRMSAVDYRESLNVASAERLDLPTLVGEPVSTPWDPDLAELMSTAGRAVEEEAVLTTLLDDLRAGLAAD